MPSRAVPLRWSVSSLIVTSVALLAPTSIARAQSAIPAMSPAVEPPKKLVDTHVVSAVLADIAATQSLEANVKVVTLAEALDYAHAHAPVLAAAKARIASAKAEAKVPDGQWAPHVGVVAELFGATSNNTTSNYVPDAAIDIPRIGGTPAVTSVTTQGLWKPYASTYAGLGIDLELFDFGRIEAQSVALEKFVDVERLRADVDRLDVDLAVEEAYFAVRGAHEIVGAAEAAYTRAKIHTDETKAGIDNKLYPAYELARAQADLARFDVGRIRAKGGLSLAQAVFAASVGAPQELLDAKEGGATEETLPPLQKALELAAERDPVVKMALATLTAQEETTKAIGAEERPNVYLSATLSGRAGGAPLANGDQPRGYGFAPVVPNVDVGLVFSWPFFDGVVNARADASKAKEDELRAEIDVQKANEVAQVQATYRQWTAAQDAIPALNASVTAAKINYDSAEARFRGALGTSLEVADAAAVLTDAEIQLALGRFELARARAVFGRAIGEVR